MLTPQQVEAYHRDGYLVIPRLIQGEQLTELRALTDRIVDEARGVAANDDLYDLEPSHAPNLPRVRRLKPAIFKRYEFFKALSTSNVEDVDLLSVEPNIDSGTVQVTAEAKDLPAMLTYLARLESNKHFRSVGVTHHEIKRNDPLRRVSFTVVVSWRYKS